MVDTEPLVQDGTHASKYSALVLGFHGDAEAATRITEHVQPHATHVAVAVFSAIQHDDDTDDNQRRTVGERDDIETHATHIVRANDPRDAT